MFPSQAGSLEVQCDAFAHPKLSVDGAEFQRLVRREFGKTSRPHPIGIFPAGA